MKALRSCWINGRWLVLTLIVLSGGAKLFAQTTTSNLFPVVTISATVPVATPTNSAVFTLFRQGNTNMPLNVFYQISGTASNGVDYAPISNWELIPAGATSNSIVITPITSTASNAAQTVILQLAPSPLLIPINYEIGVPSNAVVYLENSGATNLPPMVSIIAPSNGSVFYTPTNIQIVAKAGDLSEPVTNVEFFAGTNDLGKGGAVVLDPPGINGITGLVYWFNWLNVPAGNFPLTAVATDKNGVSTTSAVIDVTVLTGPPTNPPPVLRIVNPANGATFWSPVNIPIYAYAFAPGGIINSVEFFANTNDLGTGQRVIFAETLGSGTGPIHGPLPPVPAIYPTNLYYLVWSNAPTGNFALTAQAAISFSNNNVIYITKSAPVNISVLPSPPPPTNRPPLVDIVATDPVAVEGTNCWVWPGETNQLPSWAAWPTAVFIPFMSCGPKAATFTVHRFGETNDDLMVPYSIGGTASNGVDYVALPGSATIPAGERRTQITIVPIDDGPPDVNKTVILALTPSTNTPPDYRIGWPMHAAAIIIDSDGPRPVTGPLPGGCFQLVTPGPDTAWFCLESSTNLLDWTPVCTNQVVNGSINFVDPDAQGNPAKYYRAVPLSGPPEE